MKLLYLCVLSVLLSVSAEAFSKGHGNYELSPEQKVERMTIRLGLDDLQQQQILTIFTETQAQRADIKQQMQALREQTRSRLSAILTAEQQALFARMGNRGKADRSNISRGMQ